MPELIYCVCDYLGASLTLCIKGVTTCFVEIFRKRGTKVPILMTL